MQTISILGATGSIGTSTLDVVGRHPDRYRVHTLAAHGNVDRLIELAGRHRPEVVAIADPARAGGVEARLRGANSRARLAVGHQELVEAASAPVDLVMAAIVGAAGMAPTMAAAGSARRLLLANKETIVMAGRLFLDSCRRSGVTLLPIDSEHNALFQCLPQPRGEAAGPADPAGPGRGGGVRRLILTASGGPFRQRDIATLDTVTPDEACAHPNWSMGRKISVDSATMMNKGLELIEAHFLFDMPPERLDVLVHPQSIVHSLVEYVDGSTLAQLGNPDMRVPIAHALGHPERIESGATALDLARIGRLDFEPADPGRFPCLDLAREALAGGGGAPCVLNAANEVAVARFLERRIRFTDIARVNAAVLDTLGAAPAPATLADAVRLDARAREAADVHVEVSLS
jgi:1-deoxy-D-xylulose-5-phosphate reductoisomerase